MSYIIYTNSGTVLTTVATGKLNTSTTSLTLVGRNTPNYGQYFNQNFVDLLSNFSSPTYLPPKNPIDGQLWYDTMSNKLKIFDNSTGFLNVNAPVISDSQPIGQDPGEFWFDPSDQSLSMLDGDGQYKSVYTFPKNDLSGWMQPLEPILGIDGNVRQVTLLKDYGSVIGALSTASFTASSVDSTGTFSAAGTSSFTVVKGLTVLGNVKAIGYVASSLLVWGGNVTVRANTENWVFSTDGSLILPGNGNGSTRFTRVVSTTSFMNLDVQHNSLDNVYGGVRVGTDEAKPFDIITDYVGNSNIWRFGETGTLRLPNGAKIVSNQVTPIVSSATSVTYYNYDAASMTVSVSAGDVVDFPNFSGQILINDHIDGQVELWLAGGAYAYRLGTSKTGNGEQTLGNITWNSGIQGYTWTSSITGTMVFVATRTRAEA